jgi:hypothetical protein
LVLKSGEKEFSSECYLLTGTSKMQDSRLELLSLSDWRNELSSRPVFSNQHNFNKPQSPQLSGQNGKPISSSLPKFVHFPFDSPLLHNKDHEVQSLHKHGQVEKEVLKIFETASLSHDYEPGEAGILRDFCMNDQKRSLMLTKLAEQRPTNTREWTNTALKILGACGAAANRRPSAESDIVSLAIKSDAPIFVREQALISLMDLTCPADDTLFELHRLTGSNTGEIYEAATLTLGALLRQRNRCKHASDEHGAKLRSSLNIMLKEAVHRSDPERIETSLLAIANSGSDHHISAIAHSFSVNPDLMRSINVRHSATTALQSIKEMGHNGAELQTLLSIFEPPRPEKAGPQSSIWHAIRRKQRQSMDRFARQSRTINPTGKRQQILDLLHTYSPFLNKTTSDGHNLDGYTNLKRQRKSESLAEDDVEEVPDPRVCNEGKTEMLALVKRIPQNGVVRGLLGVSGGVGEGQYSDPKKTCVKYGYAEARAAVEIFTGVDIAGLNPLSIDIMKLSGRILTGAKCPCPPRRKRSGGQKFRLKVFAISKKYGPRVARRMLKKLSKNAAKGDIDLCPASCKTALFKLDKGMTFTLFLSFESFN